jgi:hypothetical protein
MTSFIGIGYCDINYIKIISLYNLNLKIKKRPHKCITYRYNNIKYNLTKIQHQLNFL